MEGDKLVIDEMMVLLFWGLGYLMNKNQRLSCCRELLLVSKKKVLCRGKKGDFILGFGASLLENSSS